MIIKLNIEKDFDVKKMCCNIGVRYWEDATVDGVEDTDGKLIPCRNGERWCPEICLESGIITNWDFKSKADIHYKVCDDGIYKLELENGEEVKAINDYVPTMMCPEGGGYGDYIIMKVNKDGQIENWKASFDEFLSEED